VFTRRPSGIDVPFLVRLAGLGGHRMESALVMSMVMVVLLAEHRERQHG